MNAVILTSILSAGNSGMYVATRMLYSLAKEGKAPTVFKKVTGLGVPLPALVATSIIGMACFATSRVGSGVVYVWLVNASGLAGFITWMGIAWSHYHFRKAMRAQNISTDKLPYRALWYPAGPLIALAMCAIVVVGQSLDVFVEGFSILQFFAVYIGLFFFLALWIGHRLVTKSKKVDPAHADLSRQA